MDSTKGPTGSFKTETEKMDESWAFWAEAMKIVYAELSNGSENLPRQENKITSHVEEKESLSGQELEAYLKEFDRFLDIYQDLSRAEFEAGLRKLGLWSNELEKAKENEMLAVTTKVLVPEPEENKVTENTRRLAPDGLLSTAATQVKVKESALEIEEKVVKTSGCFRVAFFRIVNRIRHSLFGNKRKSKTGK